MDNASSHTSNFSLNNLYNVNVASAQQDQVLQYNGTNWVPLVVMVALGWHVVWQLYKKSGKIQGM